MSDLIALARRHKHIAPTHYEGCEADHVGCLVNKLADEVEKLLAEIKRLHQAHQAACEGGDLLREEIERLRAENEMLIVEVTMIERMAAGAIYSQESIHAAAIGVLKHLEGKP